MARKRDHKAEYQARKRKALQSGYASEREYKAARKRLNVPRNASPISRPIAVTIDNTLSRDHMRYIRRQSARWSDKHSYVTRSRFGKNMTDDQVERYYKAFVEPITEGSRRGKAKERRRRIHDYLVPDYITEREWMQQYGV